MSRTHFAGRAILTLGLVGSFTGCAANRTSQSRSSAADRDAAGSLIAASELRRDVETLSSDAYEGRGPGTRGEDSTVRYIAHRFAQLGLRPGNNGSFFQDLPLIGKSVRATGSYEAGARRRELRSPQDFGVFPWSAGGRVDHSPVVFAGYGVVAPEYGWNAYSDLDVRGKTVMLLSGAVTSRTSADSAHLRALVDKWRAEGANPNRARRIAAFQRGASAVIYVHEDASTGSTYTAFIPQFAGEAVVPAETPPDTGHSIGVMVRREIAVDLIAAAGKSFDDLKRAAGDPGFHAVPLGVSVSFDVSRASRRFVSRNVIALVGGTAPSPSSEYVLYTAHWDHLGRIDIPGDQIYNGAVDNAGGVAQLLAIAEALASPTSRPKRSVVFIATTAEEAGLLGSSYYVAHPIYPLERTVAVINLDWFTPWGRTLDVISIGYGNTTLDDILEEAARSQGRRVTPDLWPDQEFFARSDHYPFAAVGIPSLFVGAGVDVVGRPSGWGLRTLEEFFAKHYHQVSDEASADWDYSGAAQDARLLFDVGLRLSRDAGRPNWKTTTSYPAFKAAHEAMLRADRR